eukprot:1720968-Rhodomonas_salina.1
MHRVLVGRGLDSYDPAVILCVPFVGNEFLRSLEIDTVSSSFRVSAMDYGITSKAALNFAEQGLAT